MRTSLLIYSKNSDVNSLDPEALLVTREAHALPSRAEFILHESTPRTLTFVGPVVVEGLGQGLHLLQEDRVRLGGGFSPSSSSRTSSSSSGSGEFCIISSISSITWGGYTRQHSLFSAAGISQHEGWSMKDVPNFLCKIPKAILLLNKYWIIIKIDLTEGLQTFSL